MIVPADCTSRTGGALQPLPFNPFTTPLPHHLHREQQESSKRATREQQDLALWLSFLRPISQIWLSGFHFCHPYRRVGSLASIFATHIADLALSGPFLQPLSQNWLSGLHFCDSYRRFGSLLGLPVASWGLLGLPGASWGFLGPPWGPLGPPTATNTTFY